MDGIVPNLTESLILGSRFLFLKKIRNSIVQNLNKWLFSWDSHLSSCKRRPNMADVQNKWRTPLAVNSLYFKYKNFINLALLHFLTFHHKNKKQLFCYFSNLIKYICSLNPKFLRFWTEIFLLVLEFEKSNYFILIPKPLIIEIFRISFLF